MMSSSMAASLPRAWNVALVTMRACAAARTFMLVMRMITTSDIAMMAMATITSSSEKPESLLRIRLLMLDLVSLVVVLLLDGRLHVAVDDLHAPRERVDHQRVDVLLVLVRQEDLGGLGHPQRKKVDVAAAGVH